MEVCPLSRGVMLARVPQPLSAPLQRGIRFFHPPVPAVPLASLAGAYLYIGGLWAYRVQSEYQDGLGPLSSPVALGVHDRVNERPCSRHVPFGASLRCQHRLACGL